MKKTILAAAAAAAVMSLSIPAAAETFTTSNGVVSIDLPAEDWKEMADPTKLATLSDGSNVITIEHLSNGEKLPDISVADDHYVNVYQAVFSTQNEVFIITGSVVNADEIPQICQAIVSAKVLQYDTKLAVKNNNAASAKDFTIAPLNQTMYVTAEELYVRSGCSTTSSIYGIVKKGTALEVKGSVQYNGADYGWYQINYNGSTAYVAASFVSTTAPQITSAPENNTSRTGNVKTIYDNNGNAITIYENVDGYWYDSNGGKYYGTTDYEFSDGSNTYSTNKPQTGEENYPVGETFTAFWANGNTTELTKYSDGFYYSTEWIRYVDNYDGTFSGNDGTTLYEFDPFETANNRQDEFFYLESQGSRRPANVQSYEGNFIDEEGNLYYDNGDGTMTDEYGDVFDIIY